MYVPASIALIAHAHRNVAVAIPSRGAERVAAIALAPPVAIPHAIRPQVNAVFPIIFPTFLFLIGLLSFAFSGGRYPI